MSDDQQQSSSPLAQAPLWRLGFRPFFLFASVFAVVAIIAWIAIFTASVSPIGPFDPVLWHAHEMIYGYATAVIAGFVLTASQNWTGRPGLQGWPLIFLFLLWSSGRIFMAVAARLSPLAAIVDLAFYPSLAIVMFPYLKPADMKVERVFFVYFALYLAGNLLMHLEAFGAVHGYGLRAALLGLNTSILMIVFMGGRLIPFFTESEKARSQPRIHSAIEFLSHISTWAFVVTQFFLSTSSIAAAVAFAAGILHLARLIGWYVRRVRRVALLWILYSSYLWIALGFVLSGFASLSLVPIGPPVHALTIGGIGIMTYGMMSRVSLGHTGRKLCASKTIIAGYLLLNASCAVRVFGPLVDTPHMVISILTSGLLWIAAFTLFLWVYAPMLVRARIDGRPG